MVGSTITAGYNNADEIADKDFNNTSDGQKQRIMLARAICQQPEIIILDEPTSALDITIQVQIIKLLQSIQKKYNLSYIFISHDMRVIKAIANRIIVLRDGKIVEIGKKYDIFDNPKDKYTQQLIKASYHLEIWVILFNISIIEIYKTEKFYDSKRQNKNTV